MPKRKAIRRMASPEQAEQIKIAIAEEEACAEETLAQAREIFAQMRASKVAVEKMTSERKRQGLSLADVEDRTGMTRSAISNLENHRAKNPTVRTLARYAQALGMQLDIRITKSQG